MKPNTPQIIFGKIIKEMVITKDGCWEYHKDKKGGSFIYLRGNGKSNTMPSYRFMWEYCSGEKIPPKMLICHHCDNPSCANPTHLFMGTPSDNMQDMIKKGRQRYTGPVGAKRKGEKHPCVAGPNNRLAKLNAKEVIEIRKIWDTTKNKRGLLIELGKKYNISKWSIGDIVHRKSYYNVYD